MYILYLQRIFAVCNPMQEARGSFLQKRFYCVEQQLKFTQFEGSIIP